MLISEYEWFRQSGEHMLHEQCGSDAQVCKTCGIESSQGGTRGRGHSSFCRLVVPGV